MTKAINTICSFRTRSSTGNSTSYSLARILRTRSWMFSCETESGAADIQPESIQAIQRPLQLPFQLVEGPFELIGPESMPPQGATLLEWSTKPCEWKAGSKGANSDLIKLDHTIVLNVHTASHWIMKTFKHIYTSHILFSKSRGDCFEKIGWWTQSS